MKSRYQHDYRYDIKPCHEEKGKWFVVDTRNRYTPVSKWGSKSDALREAYRLDRLN